MDPARYRQVRDLVVEALALPPARRTAFLDRACAGDAEMRREVEDLLDREDSAPPLVDGGLELGDTLRGLAGDPEALPDRIGPYTVTGLLGEGGMGVVYRARQEAPLRREVALKVLRRGMDTDRILERFAWERRSLARMDHPHIARILDAGSDDGGRPWVALELVEGDPITRWCAERRPQLDVVLRLVEDVCRAVQHAHDRGVLHRDLKPGNVLVHEVDGRPVPSIIDFGIAKALDPGDGFLTLTGQQVGTPAYMSPEQKRGDADVRSDVYALGLILYEILAGVRPDTEGDGPPTAPSRAEPAAVATATRRRLRGDLDRICLMAIRPEPERRYPSAAALADDLQRFREGRPVAATPDSLGYRLRKAALRHPAAVTLLAAGAFFAVTGVVFLAYHVDRLERERRRAVAAEALARSEEASARGIAEFLEQIFTDTDAEQGAGANVTAVQLLERGAARLETELDGQPLVRGRLQRIMGGSLHSLARPDRAEDLLLSSLASLEAVPDPQATVHERARVHGMLGTVLHDVGRYDEAEAAMRRALDLYGRDPDADPLEVLAARSDLAACVQAQGRLDDAVRELEAAVDAGKALGAAADQEVAWNRNLLGYIMFQKGDYRRAHDLCEQALATQRGLFAGDDIDLAASLNNVGGLAMKLGDLAEARRLLSEALEMYRRIYDGQDHPAVARGLSNLGEVLVRQGDVDVGAGMSDEGLAMMARAQGSDNVYTLVTQVTLGRARQAQGHHAEADSLLRGAVAGLTEQLGEAHRRTREAQAALARAHLAAGRTDQAERELAALVAAEQDRLADDHPELNLLRTDLAAVRLENRRRAEAANLLRRAAPLLERALGPDHPQARRARDLLQRAG